MGHHFAALFRPISDRKPRERGVIRIWRWKPKEEVQIPNAFLRFDLLEYEFAMFEELGEDDLRIFLRLLELAGGRNRVVLDPWTKKYQDVDGELVERLKPSSDCRSSSENSRTLPVVRVGPISCYEFLKPMTDRYSKKVRERLKKSLERMSRTTVHVSAYQGGKKVREMSSSLISYAMNHETGRFVVALNPFVAGAILRKPLSVFVQIDAQALSLKGTPAVLLSFLSAWLKPGGKGRISLTTLERHVYNDNAKNKATRYKRHKQLRIALQKINDLEGWRISEVQKGVFEVKRQSG